MWIRVALLILLVVVVSTRAKEHVINGDFEEPIAGEWFCNGCTQTRVSDAVSGQWSARVTNRRANWAGISQMLTLKAGGRYKLQAYVKILNTPDNKMWFRVMATLAITSTAGRTVNKHMGRLPFLRQEEGWQFLGGDVMMPTEYDIKTVKFYVQVTGAAVNYQIDKVSITDLEVNANWEKEANQRIEKLRKSNAKITIDARSGRDWRGIQIEATQKRHLFAFGTAVNARVFNGEGLVTQKYKDFFYENFQWAVLENALKWRLMESVKGKIDYERPTKVLNELNARGIPVRGHCVYWGIEKNLPDWLKTVTANEIPAELRRRLEVVRKMKGKLVHWDVNNENLHGRYFEEKLRDPKLMETLFREVAANDPTVKLFLNDFAVVRDGQFTWAYVNQAKQLKDAGAPLYGIGLQSHIPGIPDVTMIQNRLDVLSIPGLPMWITELDVNNPNVQQRADGYENVLRVYFSHPLVEGILLWGFWSGKHSKPDAALVDGNDFKINEAGKRWQDLMNRQWHTQANFTLTAKTQTFDMRGFQGEYEITIRDAGGIIKTQMFSLTKKDENNNIWINI